MNYYDALRLAVGSVVVTRTTTPPFAPLKVHGIYRDELKKKCLVRAKPDNWIGPDRSFDALDLDRAPVVGRWDPDRRAWFHRTTGEQVLPKPGVGRVIHYHGGPCTPNAAALELWKRGHAMVSFFYQQQVDLAAEVCQSFVLDCGAFSAWKAGASLPDWGAYREWVHHWGRHPACDWAIIPDVIDDDETANDALLSWWHQERMPVPGVPVWHLHESLSRLKHLARSFGRVALGSSGQWENPGTVSWWERMHVVMLALCDEHGRPPCKFHGLRMLDNTICSHLPLASADSTNVARNVGIDGKWDRAAYAPRSKELRARILRDRIEEHASAATYQGTKGTDFNLELLG